MAAARARRPRLSNVWEKKKDQWRRELTLRASLNKTTVKDLINNGVAPNKLDQPWISVKEHKMVRGGLGIGCEVCCRMLERNTALLLRTEMATFSCINTRKDALEAPGLPAAPEVGAPRTRDPSWP